MSLWSGISNVTRAARKGIGAATGAAGRITPGVPRVVSGAAARMMPSAMRAPAPAMGLADRVRAARGVSAAVSRAEQAAGRAVGVNPNYRFASPGTVRKLKFW